MARETKAERDARLVAEQAAAREQERETYPARLMAVLERAQQVYAIVEINAAEMSFKVIFRDSGSVRDVPFFYDPPLWSEDLLHDLDREVKDLEFEREEARRVEAVRVSALSKLSDEEQKVLGLKKERETFNRW